VVLLSHGTLSWRVVRSPVLRFSFAAMPKCWRPSKACALGRCVVLGGGSEPAEFRTDDAARERCHARWATAPGAAAVGLARQTGACIRGSDTRRNGPAAGNARVGGVFWPRRPAPLRTPRLLTPVAPPGAVQHEESKPVPATSQIFCRCRRRSG
jgi:hypothetical protein